jgi:hypothetical protein
MAEEVKQEVAGQSVEDALDMMTFSDETASETQPAAFPTPALQGTPPRTVPTSSQPGSGGRRGPSPGSNYDTRAAAGKPSKGDVQKDLDKAKEDLKQVTSEYTRSSLVLTVLTRSLLCVRAQVTSERDMLRKQVRALQDKITAGQAALA